MEISTWQGRDQNNNKKFSKSLFHRSIIAAKYSDKNEILSCGNTIGLKLSAWQTASIGSIPAPEHCRELNGDCPASLEWPEQQQQKI